MADAHGADLGAAEIDYRCWDVNSLLTLVEAKLPGVVGPPGEKLAIACHHGSVAIADSETLRVQPVGERDRLES
jgi:hypothetical protein